MNLACPPYARQVEERWASYEIMPVTNALMQAEIPSTWAKSHLPVERSERPARRESSSVFFGSEKRA